MSDATDTNTDGLHADLRLTLTRAFNTIKKKEQPSIRAALDSIDIIQTVPFLREQFLDPVTVISLQFY